MTNISNLSHMTNMTNGRFKEFRVRRIPDEMYKQFKIISVLKGLTVNELFLETMTEIVEKENNKKQEKNNMG